MMNKCIEHSMNRMYLICMEKQCRYRLICWKCHQQNKTYQDIQMDRMLVENRKEMKILLDEIMNNAIKETRNDNQLVSRLDQKVRRLLSDRNQNMVMICQLAMQESKVMAHQSKQDVVYQLIQQKKKTKGLTKCIRMSQIQQSYKTINRITGLMNRSIISKKQ